MDADFLSASPTSRAGSTSPGPSGFVSPASQYAPAPPPPAASHSPPTLDRASSSSAGPAPSSRAARHPAPARTASTHTQRPMPHVAAGGDVAVIGPGTGTGGGVARKTVREETRLATPLSSSRADPSAAATIFLSSDRPHARALLPSPSQVFDRPECLITWAADFPDRLRLIKRLTLFPLRLALRADYHRPTRSFSYGCAASDALWGGSLLLDAASQSLHYHKAVPVGGGACVGIHAAASYGGLLRGRGLGPDSTRPSLSFQYELGGGAAVWTGGRIDGRHRFRLAKGLGLEVLGFAQLPAPRARYTAGSDLTVGGGSGDGGGGGGAAAAAARPGVISLGEGPLHLHFEEVNVVLEI